MTPVLHQQSAPRCSGGPRLQTYGEVGDVCQLESCGARLSDYNPRDRCQCHVRPGQMRTARKRGEVASALCEAQTKAAPPPRHTREEAT